MVGMLVGAGIIVLNYSIIMPAPTVLVLEDQITVNHVVLAYGRLVILRKSLSVAY